MTMSGKSPEEMFCTAMWVMVELICVGTLSKVVPIPKPRRQHYSEEQFAYSAELYIHKKSKCRPKILRP